MKIIVSIIFTLMLVAVGDDLSECDWVLVKDKNNITIYSRHSDVSNIKEIEANTSVNASIADLTTLLMDVENLPDWMPNVKSTRILKKINENEIYYYIEVKVPWPFTNRDNIMHIKVLKNPDTGDVCIDIGSDPDYIPDKEGLVRIKKSRGMWKFSPNENGSTDILLRYLADPGGNVPVWVVNLFVADIPYKTLTKLKEIIKVKKSESTKVSGAK